MVQIFGACIIAFFSIGCTFVLMSLARKWQMEDEVRPIIDGIAYSCFGLTILSAAACGISWIFHG